MKMRFLPEKPRRLLILLAVLIMVVAGDWWYRRWHPTHTLATEHYLIVSSATAAQTKEIGEVVEALYAAYGKVLAEFPGMGQQHPRLQLKLYKNRAEFRRCNRRVGWAEAFYRKPCCHAYYSSEEINPYHWMLHEAIHQLNDEVTQLRAPQWLDEGLGDYFGCSLLRNGTLQPGQIDRNTYPIWWLEDMALSGDIARDIANSQIIPLRAILSGQGGPSLNRHFNLYYIHWWSLTHFLFEHAGGKYRTAFFRVIREKGTLESFEKNIGPIERVQAEWYQYLQDQKTSLPRPRVTRP
jgi:hypothetical protein